MKDKQMFGNLKDYLNKEFYAEHQRITIATDTEENEYEIICVFKSLSFKKEDTNVFKYYNVYSFADEQEYNKYLDDCRAIQLYDTGKIAKFGEQLITLITCEYSQENGRLVVVAKKI